MASLKSLRRIWVCRICLILSGVFFLAGHAVGQAEQLHAPALSAASAAAGFGLLERAIRPVQHLRPGFFRRFVCFYAFLEKPDVVVGKKKVWVRTAELQGLIQVLRGRLGIGTGRRADK